MARALKPGGHLILQGYTPQQLGIPHRRPVRGGEPLLGPHCCARPFAGLDIVHVQEYEDVLEGVGHKGRSALVGLVARRPPALGRAPMNAMRAVLTGHNRGLGEAVAAGCSIAASRCSPSHAAAIPRSARHGERLREVALDLADAAALVARLGSGMLQGWLAGADEALADQQRRHPAADGTARAAGPGGGGAMRWRATSARRWLARHTSPPPKARMERAALHRLQRARRASPTGLERVFAPTRPRRPPRLRGAARRRAGRASARWPQE